MNDSNNNEKDIHSSGDDTDTKATDSTKRSCEAEIAESILAEKYAEIEENPDVEDPRLYSPLLHPEEGLDKRIEEDGIKNIEELSINDSQDTDNQC